MSDEPLGLADLGYPTADTVRRAQAYHDILTDLIAELVGDDGDGHAITADGTRLDNVHDMMSRGRHGERRPARI